LGAYSSKGAAASTGLFGRHVSSFVVIVFESHTVSPTNVYPNLNHASGSLNRVGRSYGRRRQCKSFCSPGQTTPGCDIISKFRHRGWPDATHVLQMSRVYGDSDRRYFYLLWTCLLSSLYHGYFELVHGTTARRCPSKSEGSGRLPGLPETIRYQGHTRDR